MTTARNVGGRLHAVAGVADQGLNSASNLLLGVALARYTSPEAFGSYGVAFACYMVSLLVGRSIVGDLLLLSPRLREERLSANSVGALRPYRNALGTAVALGGAVSVVVAAAAMWLGGALERPLLLLAVSSPLLLLQDALRYFAFASGDLRFAVEIDALWVVLLILGYPLLIATDRADLGWIFGVWCSAGVVSALAGCLRSGLWPSGGIRAWLGVDRRLQLSLVGDYTLLSALQYLMVLVLGSLVGLGSVAGIRGAQLLLGPASTVSAGLSVVAISAANRREATLAGSGTRPLALAGVVAACGFGCVLGFVLAMPESWGTGLMGQSWPSVRDSLPWLTSIAVLGSLGFIATTSLRIWGQAQRGLAVRAVVMPATLAVSCLAAVWWGLDGALPAWAGMTAVGTIGYAFQAWRSRPRVRRLLAHV